MTDDFDKMLHFDPLLEAEKLTGNSYKEDEATSALGMLMMMQHNAGKQDELALRDDTFYGSTYADYVRIVEELGFTRIYGEAFTDTGFHGDEAHEEEFALYWRAGLLLRCESYRGKINSSTVYLNAEFPEARDPWAMHMSGHLHGESYDEGRYVWVGDFDGREALRHNLARLEAKGTILPSWVEHPFLWLVTYMDTKGEYDHKELTNLRLAQLPAEVLEAIGTDENA